jgi:putative acetyltransferase
MRARVEVRDAQPGDAGAIRVVHVAAFPTAMEADLVERLEREGDAVQSLVAVEGGEVVGHVLLSRMAVEADGRDVRAVGLGPVAVLPRRQTQGIGSALVRTAVEQMDEQGEQFVFLVGEPEYYGRFGFAAATAAPFASPYAGPYFQALALNGATPPIAGRADYAPAFSDLA